MIPRFRKIASGLVATLAVCLVSSRCAATVQTAFDNLDCGRPEGAQVERVEREGYALGFSDKYKQSLWVQYRLTKDEVLTRKASRLLGFMPDPAVRNSAVPEDYRTPKGDELNKQGDGAYDRGHLAPASDMHWSEKVMTESFYMSNVSPQLPSFNRGIWKSLEQTVRRFAYSEDFVWVVTGPVFGKNWDGKTIGDNKVAVPWGFYKAVYSEKDGGKMIGFVLKHAPGDKDNLKKLACSVADVEKATGLVFFGKAPAQLKKSFDPAAWQWTEDRRKARQGK